jgi:hypothetical protein
MWTVVLERGQNGNVTFQPEQEFTARQRAKALCDLHSCNSSISDKTITVHASSYYTK